MSANISIDRVRALLDYDAVTGVFTWKVPRKRNQVKAGSEAGTVLMNGYRSIGVDKVSVYAHRLAWFIVNERWPARGIDHVDGNKLNNAIRNLREANQSENAQNTRRPKNNTSGVTGVSWHGQIGKWFAYVRANGRRHSAGCFESFEEAIAARHALKAKLHAFHPEQVTR